MNELDAARAALRRAGKTVRGGEGPEQVVLYDLAYMASALEAYSVRLSRFAPPPPQPASTTIASTRRETRLTQVA